MPRREIVGPVNIGASIIQRLVEAVEDAGGQEADLVNVITGSELRLRAVGEFILNESNTFSVVCEGSKSPRNFALEMGLRLDGGLEIDSHRLEAVEHPLSRIVRIKLVRSNKQLSMIEAEQYLRKLGLRPATLIEILYLIKYHGKSIGHKIYPLNPLIVLGERMTPAKRQMFIYVSPTSICVLSPTHRFQDEKRDKNTFWAGVEIDQN